MPVADLVIHLTDLEAFGSSVPADFAPLVDKELVGVFVALTRHDNALVGGLQD